MNEKTKITLYIIVGVALGVVATALIQTDYRRSKDNIYMDIGRDPIYPISIFSSSDTTAGGVSEIVIEPDDPRMDGLISWLSGISAVPEENNEASLEFDLDLWKARPTTQTSVLVQKIADRELILVIRGDSVISCVANRPAEQGFTSNSNRSLHFELQMLAPPSIPEEAQNVGHPPSRSEDAKK